MIKRVFIPLVVLGQDKGELLELYIKPRRFSFCSCFVPLQSKGLKRGVQLAEEIIQSLKIKTGNGLVYCANPLSTST